MDNLSPQTQREMLRTMQVIRRFEERASDDFHAGHIYGVVHCYIGQEAVAVGVCSVLEQSDKIISTHRGHGHCIAKGVDVKGFVNLSGAEDKPLAPGFDGVMTEDLSALSFLRLSPSQAGASTGASEHTGVQ